MYALIYVMIAILCNMFLTAYNDFTDPVSEFFITLLAPIMVFGVMIVSVLEMVKHGLSYLVNMFRR